MSGTFSRSLVRGLTDSCICGVLRRRELGSDACTMGTEHVSCPVVLMFEELEGGGGLKGELPQGSMSFGGAHAPQ